MSIPLPRLALLPLIVALLALVVPADTVAYACTPGSTEPHAEVDATAAGASTLYVSIDCFGCDLFHTIVWVYEESNGIPGLQRGDEVKDDTCGGQIPADHIVV